MVEVNFLKVNSNYVAELKLSGTAAIHIEKAKVGNMNMYQRHTDDGEYVHVTDKNLSGTVIDFTISDDMYPVYLKFISSVPVTKAVASDEVEQIGGDVKWIEIKQAGQDVHMPFILDNKGVIYPLTFIYNSELGIDIYGDVYEDGQSMWISNGDHSDNYLRFFEFQEVFSLYRLPYDLCDTHDTIESIEELRNSFVEALLNGEVETYEF